MGEKKKQLIKGSTKHTYVQILFDQSLFPQRVWIPDPLTDVETLRFLKEK